MNPFDDPDGSLRVPVDAEAHGTDPRPRSLREALS